MKRLLPFIIFLSTAGVALSQESWDVNYHEGSGHMSGDANRQGILAHMHKDPGGKSKMGDLGKESFVPLDSKGAKKKWQQILDERLKALEALKVVVMTTDSGRFIPCSVCVAGTITCQTCKGARVSTCPICNGKKELFCRVCDGSGITADGACSACKGLGKRDCQTCHNKGTVVCTACSGVGLLGCKSCRGTGVEFAMEKDSYAPQNWWSSKELVDLIVEAEEEK